MTTSLLIEAHDLMRPFIQIAIQNMRLFASVKIFLILSEKRTVSIYKLFADDIEIDNEFKLMSIPDRNDILNWLRNADLGVLHFSVEELYLLPDSFRLREANEVSITNLLIDRSVMDGIAIFEEIAIPSHRFDTTDKTNFIHLFRENVSNQLRKQIAEQRMWTWMENVWQETSKLRTKAELFNLIVEKTQQELSAYSVILYPHDYADPTASIEPYVRISDKVNIPPTSVVFSSIQPDDYGRVAKKISREGYLYVSDVRSAVESGEIGSHTAQISADLQANALAGLRLVVRKKIKGFLFIYYEEHSPTIDRLYLENFAQHLAFTIETTWRRVHLHRANAILKTVFQIASLMTGEIDGLLALIANRLNSIFGSSGAVCFAYDQKNTVFSVPGTDKIPDKIRLVDTAYLPIDKHLDWSATFYDGTFLEENNVVKDIPFIKNENAKACAIIPLGSKKRRTGLLYLIYRKEHHFTTDEKDDMNTLAQFLGAILEQNVHFRGLIEGRDSLSGRSLQRWYSEVANTWGHEVTRLASNIQLRAEYLRDDFTNLTQEQNTLWAEIIDIAGNISDIEIFSAPLDIEEQVGLISVNAFLRERIIQLGNRFTFHALNFIFETELSESILIKTSPTWLRWSMDIILKTIRNHIDEKSAITIHANHNRHGMIRIAFHYHGRFLSKKLVQLLNDDKTIIPEGQKIESIDLLLAKTVLKTYNGIINASNELGEHFLYIEFQPSIYSE